MDLDNIASACTSIGDETSDEVGFVKIERLLERFGARIFIRPLLVEGMLATLDQATGPSGWAVLVDSEKFSLTDNDIAAESPSAPLPARFRNTVAHELVHSLAFRTSEFGIRLRGKVTDESQRAALVEEIESDTEKLSPLLLCSRKSLEQIARKSPTTLGIVDLCDAIRALGISREVLTSRLCMLGLTDSLRESPAFRNLAVGVAEWKEGGKSSLRSWPLYWNFDQGFAPEPVLKLLDQVTTLGADQAFLSSDFMMCGGQELVLRTKVNAGTKSVPAAKKMDIEITFEAGGWREGEQFLFAIRGLGLS